MSKRNFCRIASKLAWLWKFNVFSPVPKRFIRRLFNFLRMGKRSEITLVVRRISFCRTELVVVLRRTGTSSSRLRMLLSGTASLRFTEKGVKMSNCEFWIRNLRELGRVRDVRDCGHRKVWNENWGKRGRRERKRKLTPGAF